MPEGAEVPIQEKHKSVEAQEYQWAKQRIEASKRLAQELKRGGYPTEQNPTVTEVNRIFKEHHKPVSDADARIYDEQRIRMIYHAPDNQESVSEDLVFFLKPDEEGHPEMLEVDGKPLFLNGDLFDANFAEPFRHRAKSLTTIIKPYQWLTTMEQSQKLLW